jgi:hypothetical protein
VAGASGARAALGEGTVSPSRLEGHRRENT